MAETFRKVEQQKRKRKHNKKQNDNFMNITQIDRNHMMDIYV